MQPRVVELTQTCVNCPAQWEGRLADGRPLYIKYRHDCLDVRFGPVGGSIEDAIDATSWFDSESLDHNDPWTIEIEKVAALTGLIIDCDVRRV